jgi:hypothetical protein
VNKAGVNGAGVNKAGVNGEDLMEHGTVDIHSEEGS